MRALALLLAAAALLAAGGAGGSAAAVAGGLFCAALWALALLLSRAARRGARVSLEAAAPEADRGGRATFALAAELSSALPAPSVEARVAASYLEKGLGSRSADVSVSVGPRGRTEVAIGAEAPHCGVIEARVEEARAHDPLGLFAPRLAAGRRGGAVRVAVVPRGASPLALGPSALRPGAAGRQQERAGAGAAPLTPDVRDVGDWREGDPLSRVHWKLSAREGRLQVKRYEDERRLDAVLALSPRAPEGEAVTGSADGRDAWYEACANAAVGLALAGAAFECLWLDERGGLSRLGVEGPGGLPGLLRALVETGAARAPGEGGAEGLLAAAREAAGAAPALLLDGALVLREGGAPIARFDASGAPTGARERAAEPQGQGQGAGR